MRSRYLLLGILLCLLTGCGQKDEITWKEPYEPSKLTEEAVTKDSASAQETIDRENGEELSSSGEEPKEQLPVEITISAAGDVTMGGYRDRAMSGLFNRCGSSRTIRPIFLKMWSPSSRRMT